MGRSALFFTAVRRCRRFKLIIALRRARLAFCFIFCDDGDIIFNFVVSSYVSIISFFVILRLWNY